MKIALISCSKNKQSYSCEAKEMYSRSQLFKKAKAYVEIQEYDQWFILSAKHGLLLPEDIIAPYNITLNDMKKDERMLWAKDVCEQIEQVNPSQIDIFAGAKYREFLTVKEDIVVETPLKRLGIGQQLSWFTKNTQKG